MSTNGTTHKATKRNPLVAPRLVQAEQQRVSWRAIVEAGTTIDEIKEPSFWSYVGVELHQFDRIEVIEESGLYFADLLVVACDRNWATVKVLAFCDLREGEAVVASGAEATHVVEHAGPHHKWRVKRLSDGEILRKEMQTKGEADGWLAEHLKQVG